MPQILGLPICSVLEDDDVVKALSSDTPQKSFTDGVHEGRSHRRSQHTDAGALGNAVESGSVLVVPSWMTSLGPPPNGVASRICCAVRCSVGARVAATCTTRLVFTSMMTNRHHLHYHQSIVQGLAQRLPRRAQRSAHRRTTDRAQRNLRSGERLPQPSTVTNPTSPSAESCCPFRNGAPSLMTRGAERATHVRPLATAGKAKNCAALNGWAPGGPVIPAKVEPAAAGGDRTTPHSLKERTAGRRGQPP